ncbi:hypothetical protein Ppa05_15700 [Planomonospora parontospora subsp. antibiotica]|nr:hypothetical protein Ppa05_15700 [Planomonospora parontospora subsp. antibiotica]
MRLGVRPPRLPPPGAGPPRLPLLGGSPPADVPPAGAAPAGALLAGLPDARRERRAWRPVSCGRSPSGCDDPGLTTYELALTRGVVRNRNGRSGWFSLESPMTSSLPIA